MAIEDIGIRLLYDATQFVNTAELVVKHFDELEKKSGQTNKSLAEDTLKVTDAMDKENAELVENINNVKKAATEQKKLTDEQTKSNNVIIDKIKNFKIFGVSLKDISEKYNSVASGGTAVGKALRINTTLAKAFGVAFKAALGPIGLLLTGIIAYFTRTQRGIDQIRQVLSALGAIVDVIVDRFSGLGETIINAFENPKQAIKDLGDFILEQIGNRIIGFLNVISSLGSAIKNAFSLDFDEVKKSLGDVAIAVGQVVTGSDSETIKDFVNEINNEAKAAIELEKRKQALIIAERNLAIETAKTRATIKELNKDAEDTTLSIIERKKAAEQAVAIEQDLLNKRKANAEENLAIIRQQNALGESRNADLQAEAEAEIEISRIITESNELQTTLQNKKNILNAESLRQIQAQKEAYQEFYNSLQEQLLQVDLSNADPIAKLQIQQRIAISQLEKQRDDFIASATLTPEQIQEITDGYAKLIKASNEEFQKEIKNNQTDALQILPGIDVENITRTPDEIEDTQNLVEEKYKSFIDKVEDFKKDLVNTLGLSPEDVKAIEDSFSTLFTIAFADVQGIDKQIEANRRYREELAKTTENIEDQLEEQQSLREQGLANDVDLLEKALNEQNALQEKAQKEAEELQRKRARAELISNLASQVSNLATAATKIFSAHSGIPFAGVAIAIGAIASMYSAFKQFKAEASADISLHTGTGRGRRVSDYFGYVNKGGQSDIPGRGQGYRIEGTNVRIGGDEFLSTEEAARAQGKFLADLNENPNRYKGIDINEVIREYHYNKIKEKENKSTYSGKEAKVIHLKDFRSLQNSSLIKELAVINNSENKKDSYKQTILINNNNLKDYLIKEYAALEKNLSGIYHNVYDILNYHYGNADQMIENNTINVMNLAEYLRSYDNSHHKSDTEIAPGITEKITSNYLKVKELVSNISYDTKKAQSNYEKSIIEKSDSPTVKEMSKKLDSVISELNHIRNKPTTYSIADNTKKIVKEWPGRKETIEL